MDNESCYPGVDCGERFYKPWYAERFKNLKEIVSNWKNNYDDLKQKSELFMLFIHLPFLMS